MKKENGKKPTVAAYIASFPPDVRKKLQLLRKTILKTAPDAEEKISYQMPAYFLNGVLVYFAAFKSHIGFFPTPDGITAFQKDLAGYRYSKSGVQFPIDGPLPLSLVRKIVKYRIRANQSKKPKK